MTDINVKLNTYNGAIAIIDILGYKDKLYKCSIEDIKQNTIDKLIRIIESANTIVNHDRVRFNKFSNNNLIHTTVIDYLFFADSLLLYIECDDASFINQPENSINSLCYATSLILGKAFENYIPLRGAISYGEFYIQKDPVIIIGKPIYSITQLERSQDWAGVVLSDDLKNFDLPDPFITTYPVPFKDNSNKEMRVINWIRYINKPDFSRCFDSDRQDVLMKKENTESFYNLLMDKTFKINN
jgi:hypothetical protein